MKIGYLTFGRDDFAYGIALCLSELKDHEIYRITPKTAHLVDWILFSCFWWEHIYLVADFLRDAGIKKSDSTRPKIIIGGFNTINPIPFLAYADFVCVGDGEGILPALMNGELPDNVLTEKSKSVFYGVKKKLSPFCHQTNNIARIEIARGCKFLCSFCAVTWLKPYREVPVEGIRKIINSTKCKKLSLFAPEPTMHSEDERITLIVRNSGRHRCDSDTRLDRLTHIAHRNDSVLRVGIEGLSEKIRKSIHKPYSNNQIIDVMKWAIASGRGGMFWYIILDLPGESQEDFEEFTELLRRVGEIPGANNFVLKPSPSVFLPTPHTPMEMDGIHWDEDYRTKWTKLFRPIPGYAGWGVMMAERMRVFTPGMRLLSMISTRAGEEFSEIEKSITKNKAIAISSGRPMIKNQEELLRCINKFGGPDFYCGKRKDGPWKIVTPPKSHDKTYLASLGSDLSDAHALNLVA
jgi:radical SAM superfamily enzyme YgiQ (UPF0313 family)